MMQLTTVEYDDIDDEVQRDIFRTSLAWKALRRIG